VSDPEVPVKVNVAFEEVAEELADKVICRVAPGVSVIGKGDTLTPAGKPLACTLTCAVKPFKPVAKRDAGTEAPA
jgi:hypothetical protein